MIKLNTFDYAKTITMHAYLCALIVTYIHILMSCRCVLVSFFFRNCVSMSYSCPVSVSLLVRGKIRKINDAISTLRGLDSGIC